MRTFSPIQLLTLFLLTALFLAGCSQEAVPASAQPRTEPGLRFFSAEEAADFVEGMIESKGKLPALYNVSSDGVASEIVCAWNEKVPTFYLPVDPDREDWEDVALCADGCTVYLVSQDGTLPDRRETLKKGSTFRVIFAGERYYAKAKLIFTGMPVLSVDLVNANGARKTSTEINENDAKMRFSYYDACDPATGAVLAFTCDGRIHIRGGTSRGYEKHSMKFSLYKDDGTGKDVSLCGLRKDDDWVLNAMYQEETKVRDMLAYDLWEKLGGQCLGEDAYCGTRMRYVEMILGGKYWGLYGLCEPEDAKQFGLNETEGGALYKVGSWTVPSVKEIRQAAAAKSARVADIELKYPDVGNAAAWAPFANYVEATYESADFYFNRNIFSMVDESNVLDYYLFLNLTCGFDNTWKNMYVAYRPDKERLYMAPWDCDISFGISYTGDTYLHLYHTDDMRSRTLSLTCEDRMIHQNTENCVALLKEKWDSLSARGITAENMKARAEEFFACINDTGAMARNRQRWPKSGYLDNLDYLKEAVDVRFAFTEALVEKYYKRYCQ